MKAKLKKGEIQALENNGIKVFNWKDKGNVVTVSTIPEHDVNCVEVGDKIIKKPKSVLDHNRTKKGVDI